MTVCACLWLGLFPLLQFGTYSTITYNKWAIMLLMTCITLFSVISRKKKPEETNLNPGKQANKKRIATEKKKLPPPVMIAIMLTVWIVFSCLVSPYEPKVWFFGASSRLEGLLTQLCYLGLFFAFAHVQIRWKPVLVSAAVGVFVFFHVVMLQRAGLNPLGLYPKGRSFKTTQEFQGTIGNIDMDVGYLCLLAGLFTTEIFSFFSSLWQDIILRFCFRRSSDQKKPSSSVPRSPLSGLITAICAREEPLPPSRKILLCFRVALHILYLLLLISALAVTVFLIITMDVQFGLITLAVLALIKLLRIIPRSWWKPVLLILLVLVLDVVWYWPGESGGIWELKEILYGRAQYSFGSNRLGVWIYSLMLAPERLLVGGGSDTFCLRFNSFLTRNGLKLPDHQGDVLLPNNFDNPHNEYIAHLINHGLPAMLLFAALILAAVFWRRKTAAAGTDPPKQPVNFVRQLSPWAVGALCYAVQAFFSFSVCLVAPLFWVVLGISAGDNALLDQRKDVAPK